MGIFNLIGTGVGSYFGGPAGGAVGGGIGSMLDGGAQAAGSAGGVIGANAAANISDKAAEWDKNFASQQLTPYTKLGQGAIDSYKDMMGTGLGKQAYGLYGDMLKKQQGEYSGGFQQSPGYQWQLNQGLDALQNSAAARGGLYSGQTMKDVNNYAQNAANTDYQQWVNNRNGFMQNIAQGGQMGLNAAQQPLVTGATSADALTKYSIDANNKAASAKADAAQATGNGAAGIWNTISKVGGGLIDQFSGGGSGGMSSAFSSPATQGGGGGLSAFQLPQGISSNSSFSFG